MKKYLVIVFIAFAIVLTGCQSESIEFDMKKAQSIIENEIGGFKEISEDTLKDVYSFDLTNIEEYVFKQNDAGDLYAIIKTNDLSKVKNNMKEYFDKVEKFNTNYSPERLEILKNRVEKEIDSYLIYIVSGNASNIYQEIIDSME